ncbi:excalibur calcium-binding domain-containing protein [Parafrankia elaeagni]|uniref:excalibur calcium-binding domain-containing protein n=1 Tax=Parafrankia elaeagni TaxID=222534 RepID=UPI001E656345|nr:excalibur calcium-binding domain-containing protein [Parafrankia elaeagni]
MSTGAGGIFLLLLLGVALLPAPRSAAERSGSAAESSGHPGGAIAGTADRAPTPVPLPPASGTRTGLSASLAPSVPPVRAATGPATPIVAAEPVAPGAGEAVAGLVSTAPRSTAPRSGAPGAPSTSRQRTKPGSPTPSAAAEGSASAYYRSCGEARAAGAAPLAAGQPGYRAGLDPDGDGVACGRGGPAARCSTEGSREVPFLTRFGCWISGLGSS